MKETNINPSLACTKLTQSESLLRFQWIFKNISSDSQTRYVILMMLFFINP